MLFHKAGLASRACQDESEVRQALATKLITPFLFSVLPFFLIKYKKILTRNTYYVLIMVEYWTSCFKTKYMTVHCCMK